MDKDEITLDLSAPEYRISERDRLGMPANETERRAFLTRHLLETAVASRYGNAGGMDAKDGRIWGRFLDRFSEVPPPVVIEVAIADFEWICKLFQADDLRLPTGTQHWRVTLDRYLQSHQLERRVGA